MKTTQLVERELLGCVVRQNHKTGYLNINDLSVIGNEARSLKGLPPKMMASYFQTDETKEFLREVSLSEGIPIDELKVAKGGRSGGTYAHPLVFLDMAMWFDQKVKVKVLNWFLDNLLMYRDNSGDSFKAMNIALDKNFNLGARDYSKIANYVANACGVAPTYKGNRWNSATEQQLKRRDSIQNNIALLADMSKDMVVVLNKSVEKAREALGEQ